MPLDPFAFMQTCLIFGGLSLVLLVGLRCLLTVSQLRRAHNPRGRKEEEF
jgi:hypothetical protein